MPSIIHKSVAALYFLVVVMSHPAGFIMVPVPTYTPTVACPTCGSQMPSTFNYCSFCGARLHVQVVLKICPQCHARIPEKARFCPECGKKQTPVENVEKKENP